MEQQLRMNQSLEIKIKMELAQALALNLEDAQAGIFGSPEEILQGVLSANLELVSNESLREGLKAFILDPMFCQQMVKNKMIMAAPTENSVKMMIVDYLHDVFRGEFNVGEENEKGKMVIKDVLKFDKRFFIDANLDPQKQQEEIIKLEEIARSLGSKGQDPDGVIRQIKQIRSALKASTASKDQRELLEKGVMFLLSLRNGEGELELRDFFRELMIFGKLNVVISERMQKRFAASFSNINKDSNPEQFETAFINTIGEYSLISMGIITPEIFGLQKAELKDKLYENLKDGFFDKKKDLDEILKKFQLKTEGTIFWNRWKTIGIKPRAITDELVRSFITKTVRNDKDKLLEIYDYQDFFEEAKRIVLESKRSKNAKMSYKFELRKLLVEKLSDANSFNQLVVLAKKQWYQKLDMFYSQQKDLKSAA
ncbi:MAG: hypothetical protein WA019_03770 [Candidatus Moraniibacteriota bacterium]